MKNIFNIISLITTLAIFSGDLIAGSTEVNFVISRQDFTTYDIKGFYEFSQSYALSDMVPIYTHTGKIFYYHEPAVDFGFTNVISELTGDTIYHATSTWMGPGGEVLFPNDSLYKSNYSIGHTSSPPDTQIFFSFYGNEEAKGDSAWSIVRETDFIHRLDSIDRYEIYVFDQAFLLGVADTADNEWIIIAFTTPIVTAIENDVPSIILDYSLSQNHPNPFNPVTNISYSLPRSGEVTLIVYNLLGEEVARLVDGYKPAGEYQTEWNASNASSGIYFYRLRSGDFTETKKMVVLK